MTILHAQIIGDKAVLPRDELDRLVELAGRTEPIELHTNHDDLPTLGLMRLADEAGAFDWLADEADLYTVADLKVRYR